MKPIAMPMAANIPANLAISNDFAAAFSPLPVCAAGAAFGPAAAASAVAAAAVSALASMEAVAFSVSWLSFDAAIERTFSSINSAIFR